MGKNSVRFVCQNCGAISPKWLGKCPECSAWESYVEELSSMTGNQQPLRQNEPVRVSQVVPKDAMRFLTGIKELDIVLGGGIVRGSLVLVGGDPGIGKSTMLLQASDKVSLHHKVLYVTGEESLNQTKLRADRLGVHSENLFLMAENHLFTILDAAKRLKPELMVIDSIQTIYNETISSAPGSVSQVRESTSLLMHLAKQDNIAVFIVGHVTKTGAIAGPKVLEHIVDTVLYFEGDKHHQYRILRAVKNRFGSTNEVGLFEMSHLGLVELSNPSKAFILNRPIHAPGSVVVCSIEGSRPVLIELQALTSRTNFGTPRRLAMGIEYNRLSILIAVLEKIMGIPLYDTDIYINVIGGIHVDEPAVDLGIATAIVSSYRNLPIDPKTLVLGEVGLTGEVRGISGLESRINEAAKMGYEKVLIPHVNLSGTVSKQVEIIGVKSIGEALEILFR